MQKMKVLLVIVSACFALGLAPVMGEELDPPKLFSGGIAGGVKGGLINQKDGFWIGSCFPANIQYFVDWGDGTNTGWFLPPCTHGGLLGPIVKAWSSQGTYLVRAKARFMGDPSNESQWSNLTVKIWVRDTIIGFVESLRPDIGGGTIQRVSGILPIHGWALDEKGIIKIEFFIDGELIGRIPYGGPRKDVKIVYPDYPNAEESGFSMVYNWADLSTDYPGYHGIIIRAYNGEYQFKDLFDSLVWIVKFHGDFVDDLTPGSDWLYNKAVTIDGVTKYYDIRIEWSKATQGFQVLEIIPK